MGADISGFSAGTAKMKAELTALNADFYKNKTAMSEVNSEIKKLQKEMKAYNSSIGPKTKEQTAAYAEMGTKINSLTLKQAQLKTTEQTLKAQISATTGELSKQGKELNDVHTSAGKASSALGGLGTAFKGAIALGGGKALVECLIGSNAQMEQYTTSFEVMLGSADKAKTLMADLTDFANTTPLELPDVTKQATNLVSYGVSANDVIGVLQKLGDLSMGNADKLESVSAAYGKMKNSGKVTLEYLNQMTENGVPILQALSDTMGVAKESILGMITDGSVKFSDMENAITSLTTGTGKFAGMMEKQSKTMTGMTSTLKDFFAQVGRDIGENSFEQLKTSLAGFMDKLNEMKSNGTLDQIEESIGNALASLVNLGIELAKSDSWEKTAKGIGYFADAITGAKNALDWLDERLPGTQQAIENMVNPFVALANSVDMLKTSFTDLGNSANNSISKSLNSDLKLYTAKRDKLKKDPRATAEDIKYWEDEITYVQDQITQFNKEKYGADDPYSSYAGMEQDARTASENSKASNSPTAPEDLSKVSDVFKAFYDDLKEQKTAHVITDAEYNKKLLDNLTANNYDKMGAYNQYWGEVLDAQDSANKTALSSQKTAANEAKSLLKESQSKQVDDLQIALDLGVITEEEYYNRLETLAKAWGENGTDYLKQVYKARKEVAEKAKEEELKTNKENFDKLIKQSKDSYEKMYEDQKKAAEKSYKDKIKAIDDEYSAQEKATDAKIKLMEEEDKAQKELLQNKIDAIDKEIEERKRLNEDTDSQKEIDAVKAKLKYSQLDDFSRMELEKQLAELQASQDETDWQRSKSDEKSGLQDQLGNVGSDTTSLKAQLEQAKELADYKKQALEDEQTKVIELMETQKAKMEENFATLSENAERIVTENMDGINQKTKKMGENFAATVKTQVKESFDYCIAEANDAIAELRAATGYAAQMAADIKSARMAAQTSNTTTSNSNNSISVSSYNTNLTADQIARAVMDKLQD